MWDGLLYYKSHCFFHFSILSPKAMQHGEEISTVPTNILSANDDSAAGHAAADAVEERKVPC